MRNFLDKFYLFCGILAAISLTSMVALVTAQIAARFFDTNIPSSDDISGYMTAWATFLGLSYAMSKNDHIRVDIILKFVSPRTRKIFFLVVSLLGLILMSTFFYHVFLSIKEAYDFGDVTSGLIPLPLWMVQLPYGFGVLALNISILDRLVVLILNTTNSTNSDEESLTSTESSKNFSHFD